MTQEILVPPVRFAYVSDNLARGAQPRPINFEFLLKARFTKLISLCAQDQNPFTKENSELGSFCAQHGIEMVHIGVDTGSGGKTKGKNRSAGLTRADVDRALVEIELSEKNQTRTLLFCATGAHTTAVLIGCLRRAQQWTSAAIFDEFACFMAGGASALERRFIEEYK